MEITAEGDGIRLPGAPSSRILPLHFLSLQAALRDVHRTPYPNKSVIENEAIGAVLASDTETYEAFDEETRLWMTAWFAHGVEAGDPSSFRTCTYCDKTETPITTIVYMPTESVIRYCDDCLDEVEDAIEDYIDGKEHEFLGDTL